jgi:hypothetical protein
MIENMKYRIFIVGCALFLTGCIGPAQDEIVHIVDELEVIGATTTVDKTDQEDRLSAPETPSEPQKASTTRPISVPGNLLLPVLFAQQAPFGNWDELHQEACEEASMIIADSYFDDQPLDERIMETKIQAFIAWQQKQGYKVDLSAQEMVDTFQSYFKRKARIVTEVTVDRIKYELAQNNLVVVPAAGRQLYNPNFKHPGPIYHVVVVVGYDNKGFIVHDVGTRKGKNYHYSFETFINAIHDWDHQLAEGGMTDEEIVQGRKVIVVVPSEK